jgi:hypothetical protein
MPRVGVPISGGPTVKLFAVRWCTVRDPELDDGDVTVVESFPFVGERSGSCVCATSTGKFRQMALSQSADSVAATMGGTEMKMLMYATHMHLVLMFFIVGPVLLTAILAQLRCDCMAHIIITGRN